MGGCCGKDNRLDHGHKSEPYTEREYSTENTNISSNGYSRAHPKSGNDSEISFDNTYTPRNITDIDRTRSAGTNPICNATRTDLHKGAQRQAGRGTVQAEIVVNRTALKENREEDNRQINVNKKIVKDVQETKNIPSEFTDIKVIRTPLKEIRDVDNIKKQQNGSTPMQIKANKKIIQDILEATSNIPPKIQPDRVYSLETVEPYTEKYHFAMSKLTNRKFREMYEINKIVHINNPYLLAQYELRKATQQMTERILYHGTKMRHLDSICTYNFDWRVVKNSKYGFGVSFANNPYYASHYSTRNHCADEDYVMILARVLIGRKCWGKPNLTCPKEGFDTTTNYDEQVLVKYDDCTFYPEFIIYFEEK